MVKCKILLDEIQEKLANNPSADITSLLQEALHIAITDSSTRREFLLHLVHYLKRDPHQREIPDFDRTRLILLLKEDFNREFLQSANSIDKNKNEKKQEAAFTNLFQEMERLGSYAEIFDYFDEPDLKNKSLSLMEKFGDLKPENGMKLSEEDQIKILCKIVETYSAFKNVEKCNEFIRKSQQICESIENSDTFRPLLLYLVPNRLRLILAETLFSLKKFDEMAKTLDPEQCLL